MELIAGYKKTEVGVIPESWCVKSIGQLCDYQNGKSLENYFNDESGFKVISIGNYSPEGKYVDRNSFISFENKKSIEKFILNKNDLTMSLNDKTAQGAILGRVLLIDEDCKFVFNQRTMRLRPRQDVYPNYLYFSINAEYVHGALVGLAKPGTQIYVNTDDVLSVMLPVPTIGEQTAIANALSDADALIGSLQKLIEKKRQIKQGAMQTLLNPYKNGVLKTGWIKKKLGEVADIRNGGTPSTRVDEFWNGNVLWCTPTDITALNGSKYISDTNRKISIKGLKNSSAEIIPENSIVMTSRATIGECAINLLPISTNQGFKNFIPFEFTDCNFLYYSLQTMKQTFIGLCSGSTFLEISKNQVFNVEICLPKEKLEQNRIAMIISDMDIEIAALETKLAKYQQIKQGMMQNLLTGRIRLV